MLIVMRVHYVPRCYMRPWCSGESKEIVAAFVDESSKSFVKIQRIHIKNALQRHNVYSLGDIDDIDLSDEQRNILKTITEDVENLFGKIEKSYGDIRKSLLSVDLNELQKRKNLRVLREFIVSLFYRSLCITPYMCDTIFSERIPRLYQSLNDEQMNCLRALTRMWYQVPCKDACSFISVNSKRVKDWPICVFRTNGVPFCFSDKPVILHLTRGVSKFVLAGYFLVVSPGIAVYLFNPRLVNYEPFSCHDVDGEVVNFLYLSEFGLFDGLSCLYGQNKKLFHMSFWQSLRNEPGVYYNRCLNLLNGT